VTGPDPRPSRPARPAPPWGLPDRAGRVMRVVGPVMGVVWAVFLLQPLQAAWRSPDGVERWVSVIAVILLAASFALVVVRFSSIRVAPASRTGAFTVCFLAGQLVLVALSCLAADEQGLVGLVFVCVSAVFVLRDPRVLVGPVVVTGLVLVLPRVVPGWHPIDDLVVSVVLATLAVFGLTQLVMRNRQLQNAQDEVAVLAVERERERIARDMHDVLGHSLTVISVKAELAARLLDRDPQRARTEVLEVQALARAALADVRGMVTATRAVTLAGELAGARQAFDAAGLDADLPGSVDEVHEDLRELFAWGLREGTTNVLRHSAARRVVVRMDADELVVDDDGQGRQHPHGATGGDSHGLLGLAERARRVGAHVESGPSPLGGHRLRVARAVAGPRDPREGA